MSTPIEKYIEWRINEINFEVSVKKEEAKRSQGEQLGYVLGWIGDCQARRSELQNLQTFISKLTPNQESV
jgi:hypothetical protein